MSLLKKIVAIVTVLTVCFGLTGPAFGATVEELLAQIAQLQAQLVALQSQLAQLQGQPGAVTGCTITSFDRNLKQGMSGDDVKCLQIILNSAADTKVAETGSGSPGNETKYFGSLTKAAVIKFQEKYASEVLTPLGLTAGTGFVGAKTRTKLNTFLVVAPACTTDADCPTGYACVAGKCELKPPVSAGLTVTLASDTPAAGTIVASSSATELARFTFTNGDASEVKVSTLKFKRMGISDDATLPSLYLFDGYNRLGDEGTLSSGVVTFNVAGGIFAIPAGGTKTISVRADILGGTSGQTVGIKLEAATDITSDASAINGTFPISGNLMSIASATNQGTATLVSATSTPISDASIEASNDFIIWQNTLTINNQDAKLEYLRLTQIGSISAGDLDNVRFYISGTQVATGKLVAGLVGQDLIFDLSASPVSITKGQTKTLTVYADIVGGASKTMRFGLEKKVDIFLKDAAFGNYIIISGTVPNRTGTQTIAQGTITITRATDSPSGNVVNGASGVSLAKFNVKANGEEIKINSLRIQISTNDLDFYSLRNGVLLLDGVQVGGTTQITTSTYATFNIYQKIPAGKTKVLEVKADIYGCNTSACASNNLTDSKTILVQVIGGDIDNAQGMKSLAMIDAPGSTVSANTLTVGSASLSLVANPAYGNQSVSAGSDTKIGSYKLTTGAFDTVNISAFTVTCTTSSGLSLSDLSNIYLKYDGKTTTAKGTVAASNSFSLTESLAPSKTMAIDVWATLSSSASGTVLTSLAVTATKATDGSDVSVSAVYGQYITTATGLISVARASDTPDAAVVTGLTTDVLLAKFTFSALYEDFTVNTIQITATTSATSSSATATTTDDFVSIYLKYKDAAGTEITSDAIPFSGTNATFTSLTLHVPNGGSGKVSVYGNMNAVAVSGYANSGDGPQLGLTYFKASSGSQPSTSSTTSLWGYQMLLYKTAPTVAVRAGITTGSLVNGTNDLYAVTITASAKGDVGLKKITFNVSPGMSATSDTIGTFKFYRGGTDITDKVAITESGSGNNLESANLTSVTSATTVKVIFDTEEVITADTSQTYYLKASVTGVGTVGENIQTYIVDDTSYLTPTTWTAASTSNFVWTDRTYPAINHNESTSDWLNAYLVATIPTDTYTLSK